MHDFQTFLRSRGRGWVQWRSEKLVPGLKTIRTLGTRQVRGWRVVSPKSHGSMSQPPPENDCIPVRLVTFMVCHRKGGCYSHEHWIFLLLVHTCLHSVRVLSVSRDRRGARFIANLCKTLLPFVSYGNTVVRVSGFQLYLNYLLLK